MKKTILLLFVFTGAFAILGQGLTIRSAFYLPAIKPHAAAAGISVVFTNAIAGTAGGMSSVDAGDTTAASSMIAVLHYFSSLGATPISDEKGNSWSALSTDGGFTPPGNYHVKAYYCVSFTGDATHTFSSTSDFASFSLIGVTGLNATPFDAENGHGIASGTSEQPGSITPAVDGELIVTALTMGDNTTGSVDSGLTLGESTSINSAISTWFAYKIQGTAAAINPTWSKTGGNNVMTVNISSFKPQ